MKRSTVIAIAAFLLIAASASAQTHPCDQVAPTSGTNVAGTPAVLSTCHPGSDPNGNAVTGFAVYDNGARVEVPMVRGSVANAAGDFEFAAPFTVPATKGVHTMEIAALSGTIESPRSTPFVLTVSLPRVAPVAPTKTRVK